MGENNRNQGFRLMGSLDFIDARRTLFSSKTMELALAWPAKGDFPHYTS